MITVDDARLAWRHNQLSKSAADRAPFPNDTVAFDIAVPYTHETCTIASEYAAEISKSEDFKFVMPYGHVLFRGKFFDVEDQTEAAMFVHSDDDGEAVTMLHLEECLNEKYKDTSSVYIVFGVRLERSDALGKFKMTTWHNSLVKTGDLSEEIEHIQIGFWCIFGMLNMKHFDKVTREPSERKNQKRQAKGLDPIPTTVHLSLSPKTAQAYQGGTHNSPRPHWRRGHVRELKTGKKVTVQPHMVMGEAPVKSYVVTVP